MSALLQAASEAEGSAFRLALDIMGGGPEAPTRRPIWHAAWTRRFQRIGQCLDHGGLIPHVCFSSHVPLSRNAPEAGLLRVPLGDRCGCPLDIYHAHSPYIPVHVAERNS